MTKAYSCVGEEQFNAYHILDDLRRSKDYVNQFGTLLPTPTPPTTRTLTGEKRPLEAGTFYRGK